LGAAAHQLPNNEQAKKETQFEIESEMYRWMIGKKADVTPSELCGAVFTN